MSLSAALEALNLDNAPTILPALREDLKQSVFTHPSATVGKAHATFEIPAGDGRVYDYDNDAAIGYAVVTACLLKLVHTKYPLLIPATSRAIVDVMLSANALSLISDHFRLHQQLYVPASADKTYIDESTIYIKSQIFLAYIGALSSMKSAPPLCDLLQGIFESLIEAEYGQLKSLSQGLTAAPCSSMMITTHQAEPELYGSIDESVNYIGLLQELQMKPKGHNERVVIGLGYSEPTSEGADHLRMWTVGMTLDGQVVAQATRSKKKDAKNIAAGLALAKLGLLQPKSNKRPRLD